MTKIIYFIVNNRHVKITKQLLEQIIGEEIAAKKHQKKQATDKLSTCFYKKKIICNTVVNSDGLLGECPLTVYIHIYIYIYIYLDF